MHPKSKLICSMMTVCALLLAAGCTSDGKWRMPMGSSRHNKMDSSNPPQMMSQESSPVSTEAAVNATSRALPQAMEKFKGLVEAGQARTLGFDSREQALRATPGAPMPIVYVRLDDLRRYDGGDPTRLLQSSSPGTIVPLGAEGSVRSAITFARDKGDTYKAVSFGHDALSKMMFARNREANEYVVFVRALGVAFAARGTGGGTKLIPLADAPEMDFKAGREISAQDALKRMVEPARNYNGDPI